MKASCHCGAVTFSVATAPTEVTECHCSLCRRYGVLWAYFEKNEVTLPDASLTETYAWSRKHVDFHRCRVCGCVSHWAPRDPKRTRFGLNARLFSSAVLASCRRRERS